MFRKMMLLLLVAAVTGGVVLADVKSDVVSGQGAMGAIITIPLKINTPESIAGINGEIDFDTRIFSNPSIVAGAGAPGFIALGNQIANSGNIGRYRFVIYSDPTKPFNASLPIGLLTFKITSSMIQPQVSTLTYQAPASSDINAKSISTVLGNVRISLEGNSVADWALYE